MACMMNSFTSIRRWSVIIVFSVLGFASAYYGFQLKFSFDFEQFFPDGDEDLSFFRDFVNEFETDDNFMVIAIRREKGAFDPDFLQQFHDFTLRTRELPFVTEAQSLTKISYPIRTPFSIASIPAIHIDDPTRYDEDKARILNDERFLYNLITPDARTLTVTLKMINSISLEESREFMTALNQLISEYSFESYHFLGRPYFQQELVAMQKREIIVSAIVSAILVTILLWLLLRRFWGVFVSLISIGLGMLLFVGLLGAWGRELNALAALYPLLMIIVGTSDVVHILSKYIDELVKGRSRNEAIKITIKEIGLATLMTSTTTAIGFLSLTTSRIGPVREFGINAAIGVMVAYLTVIIFTTTVLTWFNADQISRLGKEEQFWKKLLNKTYLFTRFRERHISLGSIAITAFLLLGISLVTTNYDIVNNLPRGKKITEDFLFFEKELAGFRPMEFAVYAQGNYKANDYAVLKQIDTVEQFLHQYPAIKAIGSITTVYKSINQMYGNNNPEAYRLPDDENRFLQYKRLASNIPQQGTNILISKDEKKARISSRINDLGADSIRVIGNQIDQFIRENTDPNIAKFVRTGTGLIIDKNSEYVRESLLYGLLISIAIISLLMALLFQNLKMIIISLVPNVFPLLVSGAILGFFNIELEAGISIIFTIVFGIAVDDSIHFLSRFKLLKAQGVATEEAIHATLLETGKPIIQTTILLFFGFLVLLFSINPPSIAIGLVISATLFSALICDLLLLPVLLRKWL
jgi:uncharacterized protein